MKNMKPFLIALFILAFLTANAQGNFDYYYAMKKDTNQKLETRIPTKESFDKKRDVQALFELAEPGWINVTITVDTAFLQVPFHIDGGGITIALPEKGKRLWTSSSDMGPKSHQVTEFSKQEDKGQTTNKTEREISKEKSKNNSIAEGWLTIAKPLRNSYKLSSTVDLRYRCKIPILANTRNDAIICVMLNAYDDNDEHMNEIGLADGYYIFIHEIPLSSLEKAPVKRIFNVRPTEVKSIR